MESYYDETTQTYYAYGKRKREHYNNKYKEKLVILQSIGIKK